MFKVMVELFIIQCVAISICHAYHITFYGYQLQAYLNVGAGSAEIIYNIPKTAIMSRYEYKTLCYDQS